MARAVGFYQALGFTVHHGGAATGFTSFAVGTGFLNLIAAEPGQTWHRWGRIIIHVDDVDAFHARAVRHGVRPEMPPADAPWGERYFHVLDPDGHELSFAQPLPRR
ncbi:MAG: VOC family protein [Candidatus Rokubacteria bacterium]|nr:VOC family protein [Candidatus Rokubacteria bacterium]